MRALHNGPNRKHHDGIRQIQAQTQRTLDKGGTPMRAHVECDGCHGCIAKSPVSGTSKDDHEETDDGQCGNQEMGKGGWLFAGRLQAENEPNAFHAVNCNGNYVEQAAPFDFVNSVVVWSVPDCRVVDWCVAVVVWK